MPRLRRDVGTAPLGDSATLATLVRKASLDKQLAGTELRLYWVDRTDVVAARSREEAIEVMRREYGADECRDLLEQQVAPIPDEEMDLPLVDTAGASILNLRARLQAAGAPAWIGGSV